MKESAVSIVLSEAPNIAERILHLKDGTKVAISFEQGEHQRIMIINVIAEEKFGTVVIHQRQTE